MKYLRPYFKALCDDNRLEIIELLIEREHCICELIDKLGLSQSTVSYHAKILHNAGLIKVRYNRKSTYYSIDKEGFDRYASYIEEKLFKPVAESVPVESPLFGKVCRTKG